MQIHSVVAQSLSHVWLFATPWAAACQTPLSSTISQSLLKFMFIESVMLSNHFILCRPLLWPSTFPSIRIFSNELTLWIRWPYLLNGHISLPSLPSMEFSRQEYWSGLPFPPPVDHVLSELITVTCLSWMALHSIAYSFAELHKPLRHDKAVIHEGAVPKHNVNHKNKYNHTSKHVLITDLLQEKLGEEFPLI